MCLLAIIDAGKNIEFGLLESAAHVNMHGFGIAVVDRGKITLMHKVNADVPNDPEEIFKLLEDAKAQQVMLHLRYKTQGEISIKNAHPFWVTRKAETGEDIVLGHNGSLPFSDSEDLSLSDTYVFVRDVAKPTIMRELIVRKHLGKKFQKGPLLHDAYIRSTLGRAVNGGSKVALMDGVGNTLIINRHQGVDKSWGWASNQYSFDRYHRDKGKHKDYGNEPWFRKNNGTGKGFSAGGSVTPPFIMGGRAAEPERFRVVAGAKRTGKSALVSATDVRPLPWITNEFIRQTDNVRRYTEMPLKNMTYPNEDLVKQLSASRPRTTDVLGIPSLTELQKLSPEQLKTIRCEAPAIYDTIVLDLIEHMLVNEGGAPKKPEGDTAGRVSGGAL